MRAGRSRSGAGLERWEFGYGLGLHKGSDQLSVEGEPSLEYEGRATRDLRGVRSWVAQRLRSKTRLSDTQIERAGVMVSELVTNVILHTTSEAKVSLSLVDGGGARVEVHDEGHGAPAVQPANPLRVGGNGLRIVEAWSDAWGIERRPAGKVIWFSMTPR
jgi:anti-sigma regulatory factor (Ser/Thr protein kinase)